MTYRYVNPGLARMLTLSIDSLLPEVTEGWKKELQTGRLTTEMRDAFVALGWLSSSRDSRLKDEDEVEQSDEPAEAVEVREPKVKPGKPISDLIDTSDLSST